MKQAKVTDRRQTAPQRPCLGPSTSPTASLKPPSYGIELPDRRLAFAPPPSAASIVAQGTVGLQTKLVVGSSADPLEVEADRVAAAVLRRPDHANRESQRDLAGIVDSSPVRKSSSDGEHDAEAPVISTDSGATTIDVGGGDDLPAVVSTNAPDTEEPPMSEEREEMPVQKSHAGGAAPAVPPNIEARLGLSRGGGQRIAEPHRHSFEARFGFDFSRIRIHADSEADSMSRALNARAFTTGLDVYFRHGEYRPDSTSGQHLLAHELTHVIQQSRGSHLLGADATRPIRRKNGDEIVWLRYQVLVPKDYTTLDEMYRLFERTVYGKEMNFVWSCHAYCDMAKNQGQVVPFKIPQSDVDARTEPAVKQRREQAKVAYGKLPGSIKKTVTDEVDKRYYQRSGDKPGTKIKKAETGKARMWEQALDDVMKDKEALEKLPSAIKQLMTGKATSYQPKSAGTFEPSTNSMAGSAPCRYVVPAGTVPGWRSRSTPPGRAFLASTTCFRRSGASSASSS